MPALHLPTGPTLRNLSAYDGFMPRGWVAVLAGAVTVYFSLTGAEIHHRRADPRNRARRGEDEQLVIVRILTSTWARCADRHGGAWIRSAGGIAVHAGVTPWHRVGECGDEAPSSSPRCSPA